MNKNKCEVNKKMIIRLNKIGGQINGIKKMINDSKKPLSIVNQITGAKRALEKVSLIIIEEYISNCLCFNGKEDHGENKELIDTIYKFIK